jgi:hypothetical protein
MNNKISEIYTVEYIEKEAAILIRMFSPHRKKKKFVHYDFALTPMDKRIMHRWSVYR